MQEGQEVKERRWEGWTSGGGRMNGEGVKEAKGEGVKEATGDGVKEAKGDGAHEELVKERRRSGRNEGAME